MSPQRTTVLVADDHPVFRDGLVRALQSRPEFAVVGEAADGRAALDALRELAPDVAVLDVKMPGLDGLQVLNAVVRDGLATRVLLLSAFLDGTIAYDAVGQGAAGYLSKDAGRREIAEAVVRIARGEVVLGTEVQTQVAAEIRARRERDQPVLSEREAQVLALIAEGRSAPQVAGELHLSTATRWGRAC